MRAMHSNPSHLRVDIHQQLPLSTTSLIDELSLLCGVISHGFPLELVRHPWHQVRSGIYIGSSFDGRQLSADGAGKLYHA
ncbi:hypothetical protein M0R45_029977 [Rubus argutus]|uniref:RES domain-containing protein n=1 Tax=Rubus argutus TaxID=59490 RepID=A0AAW1WBM5_RUBAR